MTHDTIYYHCDKCRIQTPHRIAHPTRDSIRLTCTICHNALEGTAKRGFIQAGSLKPSKGGKS